MFDIGMYSYCTNIYNVIHVLEIMASGGLERVAFQMQRKKEHLTSKRTSGSGSGS
jgi:hypothetical protein